MPKGKHRLKPPMFHSLFLRGPQDTECECFWKESRSAGVKSQL
jgi:hypothetical protein